MRIRRHHTGTKLWLPYSLVPRSFMTRHLLRSLQVGGMKQERHDGGSETCNREQSCRGGGDGGHPGRILRHAYTSFRRPRPRGEECVEWSLGILRSLGELEHFVMERWERPREWLRFSLWNWDGGVGRGFHGSRGSEEKGRRGLEGEEACDVNGQGLGVQGVCWIRMDATRMGETNRPSGLELDCHGSFGRFFVPASALSRHWGTRHQGSRHTRACHAF